MYPQPTIASPLFSGIDNGVYDFFPQIAFGYFFFYSIPFCLSDFISALSYRNCLNVWWKNTPQFRHPQAGDMLPENQRGFCWESPLLPVQTEGTWRGRWGDSGGYGGKSEEKELGERADMF